jgi:predicted transcriptional regulator YdeE
MFLFNKENVYIGYSIEELSKVRGPLEKEGIKHSYKVVNHSGQWPGRGTRRGKFGSYGIDMDYEKQYAVYVHRKDFEKVKHLVDRALHQ